MVEAGPSLATRRQEAFRRSRSCCKGTRRCFPSRATCCSSPPTSRWLVNSPSACAGWCHRTCLAKDRAYRSNSSCTGPATSGRDGQLIRKEETNQIEREDGALKHMLEEFRAETERLSMLVKNGAMPPEALQAIVVQAIQQTLATRLPALPPSMIAPIQQPQPPQAPPLAPPGALPGAPDASVGSPT